MTARGSNDRFRVAPTGISASVSTTLILAMRSSFCLHARSSERLRRFGSADGEIDNLITNNERLLELLEEKRGIWKHRFNSSPLLQMI